jgi:hypothetical protein
MDSLQGDILELPAILLSGITLVLIFALNWLGYQARKKVTRLNPRKEVISGTAEGSLLGLMALLLAFTFGMASTKFENRRQIIIDEANTINAVILRYDLYPDSIKQQLLPYFKLYLESRIDYYTSSRNKIKTALDDANKYFDIIWNKTRLLRNDPKNQSQAELMVPLLISMKGMIATREATRRATIPSLIIVVMVALVFLSSFITGYGAKPGDRNHVISLVFVLMTTAVLFLIMELSRPTQGFINLDSAQQNMIGLEKLLK